MTKTDHSQKIAGSFRDPEGFVFKIKGEIFRQINDQGKSNFDLLSESGLYDKLKAKGWLIGHEEVEVPSPAPETQYKIIKPEEIYFVSYPYEWSFSQIKDAALLTLDIQKEAILHGMSMKDASAYNIQFDITSCRPILIDTLSFERLDVHRPWSAYRQFCQHFLAPLALMAFVDIRLNQLLRTNIDGIPLDIAWKLLPKRSLMHAGLFTHIYLHSKAQLAYADTQVRSTQRSARMTETQHLGIIDGLRRTVARFKQKKDASEWGDYYAATNYDELAFEHKKGLVSQFIEESKANSVWDLGGNTGEFSRLASERGIPTLSFDIDPNAVDSNYQISRRSKFPNTLPLILDLTNPSPDLGWNNEERQSVYRRRLPDLVLALALVHHLAISNNLPLGQLAQFFGQISPKLIVEFVPKSDSQVKRLFLSREDIFPHYNQAGFEAAFEEVFTIKKAAAIKNSERTLYFMERKKS